MENKISEKYLKNLKMIIESGGKLVSLTQIYNDYDRPKYKSPRRYISYKRNKQQIEYAIKESGYQVEQVIQYTADDILVSGVLAMSYLNQLDVKSYFHYYFGDNGIFKNGMSGLELFDKWFKE